MEIQTAFVYSYSGFVLSNNHKLLTIAKNNLPLNHVRNRNFKSHLHHNFRYKRSQQLSYESRKEKSFRKQQKKANSEIIKNNIFNLLNENIFRPLRNFNIETYFTNYFLPLIKFDPYDIRESGYYDEGLKHLIQDIDDFEMRFSWLEKEIYDYNKSLENFESVNIKNIVSQFLEMENFKVIDNPNRFDTDNTVEISQLINQLKRCWREKNYTFNLAYKNGYLKINNSIDIAKATKDREDDLMNIIESLKTYEEILQEHKNIEDIFTRIIGESQKLSKDIDRKTIMDIEKGVYKTTCEDCKKYINGV